MMESSRYQCPKCGCKTFENDKLQLTSGSFAKLFDVKDKCFIAITCTQCGYTELYKSSDSNGLNIVDFLMN